MNVIKQNIINKLYENKCVIDGKLLTTKQQNYGRINNTPKED